MTKTTLLETARKEIEEHHASKLKELEAKQAVFAMLPDGEIPTVCNFGKTTPHDVRAWISYHGPSYDPENTYKPVEILKGMEALGWKLIPSASLIKFDTWRRSIEPSALADAQAHPHKSGYKFTDGDSVAPYWVIPNQYTGVEFCAYMIAPDGEVYRVIFKAPLKACISCRRVENFGGWRFDGEASLSTPPTWPIHNHSDAYKDTEQGISGAVYFHADSAKATASEALESLLA